MAQYRDFTKKVGELCGGFGAQLIYAAVVAGFRLSLGGVGSDFEVSPPPALPGSGPG